jgi:hypothetical protein
LTSLLLLCNVPHHSCFLIGRSRIQILAQVTAILCSAVISTSWHVLGDYIKIGYDNILPHPSLFINQSYYHSTLSDTKHWKGIIKYLNNRFHFLFFLCSCSSCPYILLVYLYNSSLPPSVPSFLFFVCFILCPFCLNMKD